MTTKQAELENIVELGKRATDRPWAIANGINRFILGPTPGTKTTDEEDANLEYVAASANSADINAQKLIDIWKLCYHATLSAPVGDEIIPCVSVKDVLDILEGRA